MKIVHSSKCLDYKKSNHPEGPERIEKAVAFLKEKGYRFQEPEKCSRDELKLVHTEKHIEKIKENNFYSHDNPNYSNIYDIARLAVGGAIQASKVGGISLMRPPGHHAGSDYLGGFCYFNNLAIAVEKRKEKTLIIDIDRHHGNGTQDIFAGDQKVKYISLHSTGYPGTGNRSNQNYRNKVINGKISDDQYLNQLSKMIDFDEDFQTVAVSLGLDTHESDPYGIGLTTNCYRRIGKMIKDLEAHTFVVLEGGYNPNTMGKNIHSFLQGLK